MSLYDIMKPEDCHVRVALRRHHQTMLQFDLGLSSTYRWIPQGGTQEWVLSSYFASHIGATVVNTRSINLDEWIDGLWDTLQAMRPEDGKRHLTWAAQELLDIHMIMKP